MDRSQAAVEMGVSIQFIDQMLNAGTLRTFHFGRNVRIRRDELKKWVDAQGVRL